MALVFGYGGVRNFDAHLTIDPYLRRIEVMIHGKPRRLDPGVPADLTRAP